VSLADTIYQMARVGVGSLPIVLLTGTLSGMVLAWHLAQQASVYGGREYVGWAVAEVICRELGPALTAVVVAAQAGSAMAAELGTMKVTEQIDALRAMATSPVEYLVAPRLVATTLVMPALVLLADVCGVGGGYLLGVGLGGLSAARYWDSIQVNLATWLVFAGMGKSVFFGMIIATVSCQQGLAAGYSAEEVGRVTTRSVVYCIVLVYAANLLLTTIFFPVAR
jgi:phospholipid/cholesterol/gamma-HCH transport system permease protein